MKNVYCTMEVENNTITIYREGIEIGHVKIANNYPILMLRDRILSEEEGNYHSLSFVDIEIIMDNWNEMQEHRNSNNFMNLMEK